MKHSVHRFWLPILAGLALAASAAHAQTIPSPYEFIDERHAVSVFGGHVFTESGRLDLGPRDGQIFGARYSFRVGGPFTLEAGASYFPTTRMVHDSTVVEGQGQLVEVGTVDQSIGILDATVRFNVTGPRTYRGLQPFLLAGLGLARDFSSLSSKEEDIDPQARFRFGTRFAGQIGAGVEWFALRRVAIRAEARDIFWRLTTPQAIVRQNLDTPSREWVQNYSLSIGLSYHF